MIEHCLFIHSNWTAFRFFYGYTIVVWHDIFDSLKNGDADKTIRKLSKITYRLIKLTKVSWKYELRYSKPKITLCKYK